MKTPKLADGYSPVIDAHAHVGVIWPNEQTTVSVEECIAVMDACGIDKACSSASRYGRFDFEEGNRMIADVVSRYPERIIGFCMADPRRSRETSDQLDRYLGDEGFRGIKLHISHSGLQYDHGLYDSIYRKAAQYRAPVLAHTFSGPEVSGLLTAARRFPEVAFIVGHSGGYRWADMLDSIAAVPNAYFDICCSCQDARRVESFVEAGGAERVLFGTDEPMLHPAVDLSQIVHADLSEHDKALILGGNIARLIGEAL